MQIFKRAIYFYYDNICLTIIFLENNKSKFIYYKHTIKNFKLVNSKLKNLEYLVSNC